MSYTEIKNGLVQVKVVGSLNIKVAENIRLEVEEALDMGEKKVFVDMSETTFIDSSGMGVLVDIKKRLDSVAGEISVFGLYGYCLEAFQQTRLIEDFCRGQAS